jgi:hypothetical protein
MRSRNLLLAVTVGLVEEEAPPLIALARVIKSHSRKLGGSRSSIRYCSSGSSAESIQELVVPGLSAIRR